MSEPRHIDALLARQLCAQGAFQVCGHTLAPFSFRHALQLEALDNPVWTHSGPAGIADLHAAAAVCSTSAFAPTPPAPVPGEYDYDHECSVWLEYLRICHDSRPRVRVPVGDVDDMPAAVPFEEYVANFILRKSHGYTRDQLFEMPVAEVLWIYTAICEQETGRRISISEAEYRQNLKEASPEHQAKIAARVKVATRIFAAAKAGRIDSRKKLALLLELEEGKLAKDWEKKLPKKGGRRGPR
jgi:hypothetical protein